LSRKTWPKLFNSGHAVWHAEQGRPYFRANAGIAMTLLFGRAPAAWTSQNSIAKTRNEHAKRLFDCGHFIGFTPFPNPLDIRPPATNGGNDWSATRNRILNKGRNDSRNMPDGGTENELAFVSRHPRNSEFPRRGGPESQHPKRTESTSWDLRMQEEN